MREKFFILFALPVALLPQCSRLKSVTNQLVEDFIPTIIVSYMHRYHEAPKDIYDLSKYYEESYSFWEKNAGIYPEDKRIYNSLHPVLLSKDAYIFNTDSSCIFRKGKAECVVQELCDDWYMSQFERTIGMRVGYYDSLGRYLWKYEDTGNNYSLIPGEIEMHKKYYGYLLGSFVWDARSLLLPVHMHVTYNRKGEFGYFIILPKDNNIYYKEKQTEEYILNKKSADQLVSPYIHDIRLLLVHFLEQHQDIYRIDFYPVLFFNP